MRVHLTYPLFAILLVSISVLGCTEGGTTQETKVIRNKIVQESTASKSKATPLEEKVAPLSEKPTPSSENDTETLAVDLTNAYNPEGRIDPFQPLFQKKESEQTESTPKKKKFVPQTPLQMVDLSQLKVSGIIQSANGFKALVEESSGKGYIVTEGTYLGNRGGKIIAISQNTIVVEEPHEDVLGKEILKKRELKITRPSGEQ